MHLCNVLEGEIPTNPAGNSSLYVLALHACFVHAFLDSLLLNEVNNISLSMIQTYVICTYLLFLFVTLNMHNPYLNVGAKQKTC